MSLQYVCLSEFDMAFNHNIINLHKNRLIILLNLDIDSSTPSTSGSECLRQYLRQYSCVNYQEDSDWFNKLLYALPVRGMLLNEEHTGIDIDDQQVVQLSDNNIS